MDNPINLNDFGIVSASTQKKNEEYIVITKTELEIIDTTIDGFNFAEKFCLLIGNILIGLTAGDFIINKFSELPIATYVLGVVGILLNFIGFFLQYKKNKNINKVIQKYKQ